MLSHLTQMYNAIFEMSKSNPVFAGILSLYGLAAAAFFVKTVPAKVFHFMRGRIIMEVVLSNASYFEAVKENYNAFCIWYGQNTWSRFSRNLMLGRINSDDPSVNKADVIAGSAQYNYVLRFIPGYGWHFFFFKGVLFWFDKSKIDSNNSYYQMEQIKLYALSRSRSVLTQLLEEFRVKYLESDRIVYTFDHNCWEVEGTFRKRGFASVALNHDVRSKIIREMDHFVSSRQWFYDNHLPYKITIVMKGPTGTGKSTIAKAIASDYGRHVYRLNLHELSSKSLRIALRGIRKGSILLAEDFDSCKALKIRQELKNNNMPSPAGAPAVNSDPKKEEEFTQITLTDILNAFDGILPLDDIIVVMTSNTLEVIDPAMLRKGRVDHIFDIPFLRDREIKEYLLARFPQFTSADLTRHYKDIPGCDLQALTIEHRDNPEAILTALPYVTSEMFEMVRAA